MTLKARRDGRAFILPAGAPSEAALVKDADRTSGAPNLLAVCAHLTAAHALPRSVAPPAPTRADAAPDLADVEGQARRSARWRWLPRAVTACSCLVRLGRASRCSRSACPDCCHRCPRRNRSNLRRCIRSPDVSDSRTGGGVRCARRITRLRPWRWSAAVAIRVRARSRSPITACCSSTSCPNGTAACSKCCGSRWRPAASTSPRAASQATLSRAFQFVAAMNPCPCGCLGHPSGRCHCTPDRIARYRTRISGPLLDRIDSRSKCPRSRGCARLIVRARTSPARRRRRCAHAWQPHALRSASARASRTRASPRGDRAALCAGRGG